jgi:TusA-related sulfurtransferase
MVESQNKADLRGLFVPETLYKLDIEIQRIENGQILLALLDDMESEDWLMRWAHRNGHDILKVEKVATGLSVEIEKGGYMNET